MSTTSKRAGFKNQGAFKKTEKKPQRNRFAGTVAVLIAVAWAVGGLVMPSLAAEGGAETGATFEPRTILNVENLSSHLRYPKLPVIGVGAPLSPKMSIKGVKGGSWEVSGKLAKLDDNSVLLKAPCAFGTCYLPAMMKQGQTTSTKSVGTRSQGQSRSAAETALRSAQERDKGAQQLTLQNADNSISQERQIRFPSTTDPNTSNSTNGDTGSASATQAAETQSSPDITKQTPQTEETANSETKKPDATQLETSGEIQDRAALETSPEAAAETQRDAGEEEMGRAALEEAAAADQTEAVNEDEEPVFTSKLGVRNLNPQDWQLVPEGMYSQLSDPRGLLEKDSNIVPIVWNSSKNKWTKHEIDGGITVNNVLSIDLGDANIPDASPLLRSLCVEPNAFVNSTQGFTYSPSATFKPSTTSNTYSNAQLAQLRQIAKLWNKGQIKSGSTMWKFSYMQAIAWEITWGVTVEWKGLTPKQQKELDAIRAQIKAEYQRNQLTTEQMLKALRLEQNGSITSDGTSVKYPVKLAGLSTYEGDLNLNFSVSNVERVLSASGSQLNTNRLTANDLSKGIVLVVNNCNNNNKPSIRFKGVAKVPGVFWVNSKYQTQLTLDEVPFTINGSMDFDCVQVKQITTSIKTNASADMADGSVLNVNSVKAPNALVRDENQPWVTLKDTVSYTNLDPKKTYQLAGRLNRKRQGETQFSQVPGLNLKTWVGKGTSFPIVGNPGEKQGLINGTFNDVIKAQLPAKEIKPGDTYVFWEDLLDQNGQQIPGAFHHDNADANQTIKVTDSPTPFFQLKKTLRSYQKPRPEAGRNVILEVTQVSGQNRGWHQNFTLPANGQEPAQGWPKFPAEPGAQYDIVEKFDVTGTDIRVDNSFWYVYLNERYREKQGVQKVPQPTLQTENGRTYQVTPAARVTMYDSVADYVLTVEVENCYFINDQNIVVKKDVKGLPQDKKDEQQYRFKLLKYTGTGWETYSDNTPGFDNDGSFYLRSGESREFLKVPEAYYMVLEYKQTPKGWKLANVNWDVTARKSNNQEITQEKRKYFNDTVNTSYSPAVLVGTYVCNCSYTVNFTATNNYVNDSAGFSIVKKVVAKDKNGVDSQLQQELENRKYYFEYKCADATQWTKTEGISPNSPFQAPPVPNGTTCTVREVKDANQVSGTDLKSSLSVSGVSYNRGADNSVIFTVNKNAPGGIQVEANNTYTRHTGGFTLTKETDPSEVKSVGLPAGTQFNFDYQCSNGKEASLQLATDETARVENLPVGTTCDIYESAYQGGTNFYTKNVDVTVDGKSVGSPEFNEQNQRQKLATITIEKDKNVAVNAKNHFEHAKTSFRLSKELSGTAASQMSDTQFNFQVKCQINGVSKIDTVVKVSARSPQTVQEVPVGAQCQILETDIPKDIKDVEFESVRWAASDNVKARFEQGETGKVIFTVPQSMPSLTFTATNTYNLKTTKFNIHKTLTSPAGYYTENQLRNTTFDFQVSCEKYGKSTLSGGVATITDNVRANSKGQTFEVLSGSTCTVQETSIPRLDGSGTPETRLDISGPVTNKRVNDQQHSITFTLSEDRFVSTEANPVAVSVAATNEYKANNGKFQLRKMVKPGAGSKLPALTNPFEFGWECVTGGDKTSDTVTLNNGEVKEINPGKVTKDTLCYVWEKPYPVPAHYDHALTWDKKVTTTEYGTHANAAMFKPFGNDASIGEIVATNTFTQHKGAFVLNKAAVPAGENVDAKLDESFNFTAQCRDAGGKVVFEKSATITANDTSSVFKGEGIPVGSQCRITENDPKTPAGHSLETKFVVDDHETAGSTVNFRIDTSASVLNVKAINTYTREYGKFQIAKQVVKAADIKSDVSIPDSFTFDYSCASPDGKRKLPARTLTVPVSKLRSGDWNEATWKDSDPIPVGYVCEVTEQKVDPGEKVNYNWSLSSEQGENPDGDTHRVKVTIEQAGPPKVKVKAINNYFRSNGGFTVVKRVDGDMPQDASAYTFKFHYACTYGTESKPVAEGHFDLTTTGEKAKFSADGIPVGAQCQITELPEVTPAVVGKVGTVSSSAQTTLNGLTGVVAPPAHGNDVISFQIVKNKAVTEVTFTNHYETQKLPLNIVKTNKPGQNMPSNLPASVKVSVQCSGMETKVVDVPVGGAPVQVSQDVPFGALCSVTELDEGLRDLSDGTNQYNSGVKITIGQKVQDVKPGQAVKFVMNDMQGQGQGVLVSMDNNYTAQPRIATTLALVGSDTRDGDGNGTGVMGANEQQVTLVDTVSYYNLTPGRYVLIGKLNAAATNTQLGEPVVSAPFEVTTPDGNATVNFTLNRQTVLDNAAGMVAFEYLYKAKDIVEGQPRSGAVVVAAHENPSEPAQTVKITPQGEIRTFAQVGEHKDRREAKAGDSLIIKDRVEYKNLPEGNQYKLVGLVVPAREGENTVLTGSSLSVTAGRQQDTFAGDWVMTFDPIPGEMVTGGAAFTVLEYLLPADSPLTHANDRSELAAAAVASHATVGNVFQTVTVPGLRTHATFEGDVKAKEAGQTGKTVKINDRVSYQNLIEGKTYTVTGRLAIKGTQNPDGSPQFLQNSAGVEYTATTTFKATKADTGRGEKVLTFTVDSADLQGKTLVVFETMTRDGIEVAIHNDINDEDQTIYSPSVRTLAVNGAADAKDPKLLTPGPGGTVKDTITYSGLNPQKSYVFYGELKDRYKLGVTSEDTLASANAVLPAGHSGSGTIDVIFKKVDAQKGGKYVVFEWVYEADHFNESTGKPNPGAKEVASHAVKDDEDQTITAPYVTTSAKNKEDSSKFVDPARDFTITDVVTFAGLDPSKAYTVSGELRIKDGSEQGQPTGVVASVEIGAGTAHDSAIKKNGTGKIELDFTVSAEQAASLGLLGKSVVAFETITHEGKTVVVHHDINDDKQSVHAPSLATTARGPQGDKVVPMGMDTTVTDTVSLQGRLEASTKYTLVGKLMDKETQQALSDSKLTFVTNDQGLPEKPLKVEFKLKKDQIKANMTLVAFETLYVGEGTTGRVVAKHEDYDDPEQTVNVPALTTFASDSEKGDPSGSKNMAPVSNVVTVYDRVDYTGLTVGQEYTLKGQLYYQADAVLADGTKVTAGTPVPGTEATKTFMPTKAKGFEVLALRAPAALVSGQAIVAFEDLKQGEVEVAAHHDLQDKAQTVYVPSVQTLASTSEDGSKTLSVGGNTTIFDVVTWRGLEAGQYVSVGSVHNAKDGKAIADIAQQGSAFTVKDGQNSGTVNVNFVVPSQVLDKAKAGQSFVVYEQIYRAADVKLDGGVPSVNKDAKPVAVHQDSNDANQSVTVAKITTQASDAADGDKYLDTTGDKVIIRDEVFYEGLNPELTYTITGQLHERVENAASGAGNEALSVGEPVVKQIGAGQEVSIPQSGKGSVILEFPLPTAVVKGKTLVAFETIEDSRGGILTHHDINDQAQTVYAASLGTQASVNGDGKLVTGQEAQVKDRVTYTGVIPGAKYRAEGQLMKVTSGEGGELSVTATPYKASKEFTAKNTSGSVDVVFDVKADHGFTAQDKLVVYERLIGLTGKDNSGKLVALSDSPVVARHEDPNDTNQSVPTSDSPRISTVLWSTGGREKDSAVPVVGENIPHLTDTVTYENLVPSVKYVLAAQLVVVDGEKVTPTSNVATHEFVAAGSGHGTVDVPIVLTDKSKLTPGIQIVAYETLYRLDQSAGKDDPKLPNGDVAPGKLVADHRDPKDLNQTVQRDYNPEISTTLTGSGADAEAKIITADGKQDVTLVDTVKYSGLRVGKEYVLAGQLMQKLNGQAKETTVRAVTKFTPKAPEGQEKVTFVLTSQVLSQLRADSGADPQQVELDLVAYEQLWDATTVSVDAQGIVTAGSEVKPHFTHHDINDLNQSVRIVSGPSIATQLQSSTIEKQDVVFAGEKVEIFDHVTYLNLEPNQVYTLKGTLMVPGETPQTSQDTGISGQTTFTTPAATGSAQRVSGTEKVKFTLTTKDFNDYTQLVAFESLYKGEQATGTALATHEDPKDLAQTVGLEKPEIGTRAASAQGGQSINVQTGAHVPQSAKTKQILTDTVSYSGLQGGATYALQAQLHVKQEQPDGTFTDGGVLLDENGEPISSLAVFQAADSGQGQTDVTRFAVPYEKLKDGSQFVVFERLYAPGSFTVSGQGEQTVVNLTSGAQPVGGHEKIDSQAQTVEVNNPQYGDFTFTKHISGTWNDHEVDPQTRKSIKYLFRYECRDAKGALLAQHSPEGKFDIELSEGQSHTVNAIPEGATCVIEEDVAHAVQATGADVKVNWLRNDKQLLSSPSNGKVSIVIGGSNGEDRVYSYALDVYNELTPNPAIATNTIGADGQVVVAENGGQITDHVQYYNLPKQAYHLHTYLVQKIVSDQGEVSFEPVDWVESKLTQVMPEDSGSGSWPIHVNIPADLADSGNLIVWEDLYLMGDYDQVNNRPYAGKKPLVAHHEEMTPGESGSMQAVLISSNLGGFKVRKEVKKDESFNDTQLQAIPAKFRFSYTVELPKNMSESDKAKFASKLSGEFQIAQGKETEIFDGLPVGSVVTVKEIFDLTTLPTGMDMETEWKVAVVGAQGWTNSVDRGLEFSFRIPARADVEVTAKNHFVHQTPTLETQAKVTNLEDPADTGKILTNYATNEIVDTVSYTNLKKDRQYALVGELYYTYKDKDSKTVATPVLGEDSAPMVSDPVIVTATQPNGTWIDAVRLTIPASVDQTKNIVFYETLYEVDDDGKPAGDPIVDHRDPEDQAQTVYRNAPEPGLGTVAAVVMSPDSDEELPGKTFAAGTSVVVRDKVTYRGLVANAKYQLFGRIMTGNEGKEVQVGKPVTGTFTANENGSGTFVMDLPLSAQDTATFSSNTKLVVFESLYDMSVDLEPALSSGHVEAEPVAKHEDMTSQAQTVLLEPKKTPPPGTPNTPGTPPSTPNTPGTPPSIPVSPSTETPTVPISTPPTTPGVNIPPPSPPVAPDVTLPPKQPKLPPVLARTGAQATMVGALALVMILSGVALGWFAARRRNKKSQDS